MISYFTKKLNIRKPTRVQIQAFIGFSFFDDCCWRCASPFHHRGDCKNDDKGIKGLCKLLHEVNHPLTAEALAAKEYYRGGQVLFLYYFQIRLLKSYHIILSFIDYILFLEPRVSSRNWGPSVGKMNWEQQEGFFNCFQFLSSCKIVS